MVSEKQGAPIRVEEKGKRGAYRYFYLFLESGHLHLLLLMDKNEQEDLTTSERAVLRELVQAIKASGA